MQDLKEPAGRVLPEVKTAADFWLHVQNPLTRVKDMQTVQELALTAARTFSDPQVRLAGVTVFSYRILERQLPGPDLYAELCAIVDEVSRTYPPKPSFHQMRWSISANIAVATIEIALGQHRKAFARSLSNTDLVDEAHALGQVFTNVVKSALLCVSLLNKLGPDYKAELNSCLERVDRILLLDHRVAEHYIINNEFAYEELSFVYSMLRQLYRWREAVRLLTDADRSGQEIMEKAFETNALGGFMHKILNGQLPPKATVGAAA